MRIASDGSLSSYDVIACLKKDGEGDRRQHLQGACPRDIVDQFALASRRILRERPASFLHRLDDIGRQIDQFDSEATRLYALINGQETLKCNRAGSQTIPVVCLLVQSITWSCYNDKTHDDRFNRPSSGCNSSATTHTTKRRISLVDSWARGEWHHSSSDGKDLWSEEQGIMMRPPLGLRTIVKGKNQGALDVVRPSIDKLENIKYRVFLQLSLLSPEQAINSSHTHTLFFTKLQISTSLAYISAIHSFFSLTHITLLFRNQLKCCFYSPKALEDPEDSQRSTSSRSNHPQHFELAV
jgi:hypothetical protein